MPKRRVRGEGSVYYDATRNRWVGQVWLDGRRRKVSAIKQEDATKALGKLIHGDLSERHADRRATVASLLADWQTKALPNKTRAPSTLERHAWAVNRLTKHLGKVKLTDLTAAKVERALAAMAATGLGKASLTEIRGTLRQALDWAHGRRMVTYNAAAAAELPEITKPKRAKRALSPVDLAKLLDALEDHEWQAMFALMGRVGLRPGEAAGVCADAVDLDTEVPTVAVVRVVQLTNGRPRLVDDLKTKGARRTIAIPPDVAAMLSAHSSASEGLLFTASDGGPVWPSTMRSELADACTRAAIPRISPNELRHSAATILADSGLAPHLVADLLGHTTTRMVDETYRHRPAVLHGAETR